MYTDNILEDAPAQDSPALNWLGSSQPFDKIHYATAVCLMESLQTRHLQGIFWKLYIDGYVMLFQRRVSKGLLSKYEYIAIRTKKPYVKPIVFSISYTAYAQPTMESLVTNVERYG